MTIFDEYPVFSRVVSTAHMYRPNPEIADEPPVGSRGTIIGHILGTDSGKPRVLVLFDGRRYAIIKNPSSIRRLS